VCQYPGEYGVVASAIPTLFNGHCLAMKMGARQEVLPNIIFRHHTDLAFLVLATQGNPST